MAHLFRRLPLKKALGFIRLMLLVGVVVYLIWNIWSGWKEVSPFFKHWETGYLLGSFLAGFIGYQCLFLGWLFFLSRAGHFRAHHVGRYYRIWWTSYFYRYLPGKVLLVVERVRMGRAVGISAGLGTALVLLEIIFSIMAAGWVSLLTFVYYGNTYPWLHWVMVILTIAILLLLPKIFRWFCHLPSIHKRFPELHSVSFGAYEVLMGIPFYLGHFLLLGLSFFLLARSLHLFSWNALPGLIGIFALSHFVGLVTMIAPAGLGVREGVLSVQLYPLLPLGLAGALAVGTRIWLTMVEILSFGGGFLFCSKPQDVCPETDNTGKLK